MKKYPKFTDDNWAELQVEILEDLVNGLRDGLAKLVCKLDQDMLEYSAKIQVECLHGTPEDNPSYKGGKKGLK